MPTTARWYTDETTGNKIVYTPQESIATDVALHHVSLTKIEPFLDLGLWNMQFIWFVMEHNKVMAQYIHSALAYGHDSEPIIIELLRLLYNPRNLWNSETCHVCRIVSHFLRLCHHCGTTFASTYIHIIQSGSMSSCRIT
jgi:hypothetical protein